MQNEELFTACGEYIRGKLGTYIDPQTYTVVVPMEDLLPGAKFHTPVGTEQAAFLAGAQWGYWRAQWEQAPEFKVNEDIRAAIDSESQTV